MEANSLKSLHIFEKRSNVVWLLLLLPRVRHIFFQAKRRRKVLYDVTYFFKDAWLITAGTNTGVVKEVGEALNKYRYKNYKHVLDVPCIGIGTWNNIAGSAQLEDLPTESPGTENTDVNMTTKS